MGVEGWCLEVHVLPVATMSLNPEFRGANLESFENQPVLVSMSFFLILRLQG